MADVKTITIDDVEYDIKDAKARSDIATLETTVNGIETVTDSVFYNALIDTLYPVGSIYISMSASAPFRRGTWTRIGVGKALVGVDTGNSLMNTPGKLFGRPDSINVYHTHTQAAHSHTVNSHTHGPGTLKGTYHMRKADNGGQTVWGAEGYHYTAFDVWASANSVDLTSGATGASAPGTNSKTPGINYSGDSGANQNYQPSIAVYIWERTAL